MVRASAAAEGRPWAWTRTLPASLNVDLELLALPESVKWARHWDRPHGLLWGLERQRTEGPGTHKCQVSASPALWRRVGVLLLCASVSSFGIRL